MDRLVKYLNDLGIDDPEVVSLFLSLLSLPHNDQFPPLAVSPMRIKARTEEILLEWLRRLADQSPLLFIVEDLHWVDPSTQEFLGRYVEEFQRGEVLTILTFRPEFQTPWHSLAHQTQIALNRLTKRQIGEMLRRQLNQDELPDHIVRQVVDRTDGVPLFVEEFAKVIESSHVLDQDDPDTDSVVLETIPSTLQDLLAARLERLDCKPEIVQAGATIGREFSYRLLQASSQVEDSELQTELDKLVTAELLFQNGRPPNSNYIFKHALIQDSAYHSMLTKRRQEIHRRIASALEETLPETIETQPELLAQHFTEGGEVEKGIEYWQKAGQHAQGRSSHAEAIHHLERGLALVVDLPPSPQRSGMELGFQLSLGVSLMAAYGYANPRVEESLSRAGALCEEVGPSAPRFPVLWGTWAWRLIRDDLVQARAVIQSDD